MLILVSGSRNYTDRQKVKRILELFDARATLLHGGAPGLDSIAKDVWEELGGNTIAEFALWNAYGKRAGPIRNQKMVDYGPDILIAFPLEGSRGTIDCVNRALIANIPVLEVR